MFIAIVGIAVMLLCFGWICLTAPAKDRNRSVNLLPEYVAHRGLHNNENPENSITAFCRASQLGYAIELDIRLTADGEVVVHHEDELQRTCGCSKSISHLSYKELREQKLFGTEERIPLLQEVLSNANENLPLLIETKSSSRWRELCIKAAALLESYKGPVLILSFDPRILRWFKRNCPQYCRGQLARNLWCQNADKVKKSAKEAAGALLLGNILSRPHFIACESHMLQNASMRFQRCLFHTPCAIWTVRSQSEADRFQKEFCGNNKVTIIFEGFMPDMKRSN